MLVAEDALGLFASLPYKLTDLRIRYPLVEMPASFAMKGKLRHLEACDCHVIAMRLLCDCYVIAM